MGTERLEGCGGGRWALVLPRAATWPYPGLRASAWLSMGEGRGAGGEGWAGRTGGRVLYEVTWSLEMW